MTSLRQATPPWSLIHLARARLIWFSWSGDGMLIAALAPAKSTFVTAMVMVLSVTPVAVVAGQLVCVPCAPDVAAALAVPAAPEAAGLAAAPAVVLFATFASAAVREPVLAEGAAA